MKQIIQQKRNKRIRTEKHQSNNENKTYVPLRAYLYLRSKLTKNNERIECTLWFGELEC